jgi:uncharacterized membrane protein (DUF2068 family)
MDFTNKQINLKPVFVAISSILGIELIDLLKYIAPVTTSVCEIVVSIVTVIYMIRKLKKQDDERTDN